MKLWDTLEWLAIAILVIAIFAFAFWAMGIENERRTTCEQQGGVVVNSYGQDNCWVDGGFIKI